MARGFFGGNTPPPDGQILSPDGVSKAGIFQHFTTRPLRPPTKVIARFNGASGWTGTGTAEDLTTKLFGDRTYKITNPVAGGVFANSPIFAAQDWSNSLIRIWLKIDNPAAISAQNIYLIMGSGNVVSTSISHNLQANEWLPVTVSRSMFATNAGTPNWAGVTQVQYQAVGTGVGTGNTWIGGIELIPDLASTYPSGVMIVEFDDGYAGQLTNAVPVLSARGIPATFNLISERFTGGTPLSGITPAQLRDLQDRHGWAISCHAYSGTAHGSSTANSVDVMEQDFQRQKHWLHANGLHSGADHLALCPGTGSPVPAGPMMEAIQRSFASVRVNSGPYETAIPADPLRLRSKLFVNDSNGTLQQHIDKTAGAGGAYILTMHDVLAGSTNGTGGGSLQAIAANNLATILDYAVGKGMVFRTRADYIAGR